MIDLPLVFLGGLLGSAHCVGMCGGFAVLLGGGARSAGGNLARQCVYSLGRIFTYAVLGAAVGYVGLRLAAGLPQVVYAQAALGLLAGTLLVVVGLAAAGAIPRGLFESARRLVGLESKRHAMSTSGPACLAGGILGAYLRAPGWGNVFLAGVFTGFLPCGLVYGFLALAGSTASLTSGAATMAVFGMGTVPLMVLAGSGASLLSMVTRQRLLRLAAWCVVLTGVISLARGVMALDRETPAVEPPCPMCSADS